MRQSRFTDEQIVKISDELQRGGKVVKVCRRHGISCFALYRWKAKYGGTQVSDGRRRKKLPRG